MMFVALLVTLRLSSTRRMASQECLAFLPGESDESDLLERIRLPYAEQNGAQKTTLSSGPQYALALLRGREGADMLRITLWGEHAFEEAAALVSHLAGHPLLVVDSQSYTVQSVSLSQHPWASQATWADLMLSRNDRLLGLRFVSPMLLHHSTDESEDLVFPEPLAVFSQLQERWMDLGGPSLTCHLHAFLEQGGCVVSDYRLHTRHQSFPYAMPTGWVGWILYECRDPRPECLVAVNSLARLSCFIGTGWATARGMGLTRLMSSQERR